MSEKDTHPFAYPAYTTDVSSFSQIDTVHNKILFVAIHVKHQDKDCLSGNNIQIMNLTSALDFENCEKWCTNNGTCGGFVVYNYGCYFKNLSCKFNLVYGRDLMTLIKYES